MGIIYLPSWLTVTEMPLLDSITVSPYHWYGFYSHEAEKYKIVWLNQTRFVSVGMSLANLNELLHNLSRLY